MEEGGDVEAVTVEGGGEVCTEEVEWGVEEEERDAVGGVGRLVGVL